MFPSSLAYSSLFQSIIAYSCIFQHIPIYSNLFQPIHHISAYSSSFQPILAYLVYASIFPNPQSPIYNLKCPMVRFIPNWTFGLLVLYLQHKRKRQKYKKVQKNKGAVPFLPHSRSHESFHRCRHIAPPE